MLHVLLTILAVAGKIILGVLGLVLLLLLLLLFVPVRYRGNFRRDEKAMEGRVTLSWFLRFLCLQIRWKDGKLSREIRILGISPSGLMKKIRNKRKTFGRDSDDPETEAAPVQPEDTQPEEFAAQSDELSAVPAESEDAGQKREESQEQPQEPEIEKHHLRVLEKLRGIFQKAKDTGNKIRKLAESALRKEEAFSEKIGRLKKFLQSDLFRQTFRLAEKELLAVFRHILPRKIWGRLVFGTGDPGTTGELLAAAAAIWPVLPEKLEICPDFDEAVLNCDLSLRGRMRLAFLLWHGGKLLLNRSVRSLIKKVRHKEANNG